MFSPSTGYVQGWLWRMRQFCDATRNHSALPSCGPWLQVVKFSSNISNFACCVSTCVGNTWVRKCRRGGCFVCGCWFPGSVELALSTSRVKFHAFPSFLFPGSVEHSQCHLRKSKSSISDLWSWCESFSLVPCCFANVPCGWSGEHFDINIVAYVDEYTWPKRNQQHGPNMLQKCWEICCCEHDWTRVCCKEGKAPAECELKWSNATRQILKCHHSTFSSTKRAWHCRPFPRFLLFPMFLYSKSTVSCFHFCFLQLWCSLLYFHATQNATSTLQTVCAWFVWEMSNTPQNGRFVEMDV